MNERYLAFKFDILSCLCRTSSWVKLGARFSEAGTSFVDEKKVGESQAKAWWGLFLVDGGGWWHCLIQHILVRPLGRRWGTGDCRNGGTLTVKVSDEYQLWFWITQKLLKALISMMERSGNDVQGPPSTFWKNDEMMKLVVEEKHSWGFCIWVTEGTATSGPYLIAPTWYCRGPQAVGEVQESLEGIHCFAKVKFVRQRIHSGAFRSPWGNHLILCCYFYVMGVLFLNFKSWTWFKQSLNCPDTPDIYGGPKAAKYTI